MQASRIIKQFDEVKMVIGKTGAAEVPTDPMPPEASDLVIILKPVKEWKSGRSYNELADAIMEKLEIIPGYSLKKPTHTDALQRADDRHQAGCGR